MPEFLNCLKIALPFEFPVRLPQGLDQFQSGDLALSRGAGTGIVLFQVMVNKPVITVPAGGLVWRVSPFKIILGLQYGFQLRISGHRKPWTEFQTSVPCPCCRATGVWYFSNPQWRLSSLPR